MAKMNKTDVKYEEKNIKSVSWDRVRALTGKTIPTVAMQTVKSLAKSNPKAYVKVGLIKKDLYLRVKDGNKHLDDIKLVANWTDPGESEGGPKKENDPGVRQVVDQIKQRLAQMKAGEKTIKLKHKTVDGLAAEANTLSESSAKQPVADYRQKDIARIRKHLTDARRAKAEADTEYNNEVEAPSASKPPCRINLFTLVGG